MGHFVTARGTCIKFLGLQQWTSHRGGEEGLRPQSQEGQDLSAPVTAEQLIFKTSTEKQTVYLTNKDLTKDSERFSPWLYSAWRTTGPIRWHAGSGGCMKVQTCGDTCEGAWATEQYTKNTMQPGWTGPFLLSLMRTENHSHLPCCSWLSSKNDVFGHILDVAYTRRTCSWSQHESFCTSLRKYVVPVHSDWTSGCPAPFTTPHSHFLLFLPPFFKAQEGFIKHWFVVFTEFYYTEKKWNGWKWVVHQAKFGFQKISWKWTKLKLFIGNKFRGITWIRVTKQIFSPIRYQT